MKRSEAAKLIRILHKVEQGILYSEKYAKLFDSHIAMTAIHEASHAVIATLLGMKVAAVEIKMERSEFDGREGITSGQVIPESGEVERLLQDRNGRVVQAAILLASTLTREFKFEWQIEHHLVEAGFGGDNLMLDRLDDETAILHGAVIVSWAFEQPFVIDLIESVAEVLNEKKMMFGKELREIVFKSTPSLIGAFTRKEILTQTESVKNAKATVQTKTKLTPFKFMGVDLVVCSFLIKLEADGRELPACFVSSPETADPQTQIAPSSDQVS